MAKRTSKYVEFPRRKRKADSQPIVRRMTCAKRLLNGMVQIESPARPLKIDPRWNVSVLNKFEALALANDIVAALGLPVRFI